MTDPGAVTPGRVAVVGASLAGLRTAQSLRTEGFGGEIVVIGDEPDMPYDRPPLSKEVLTGVRTVESTALDVPGGIDGLDVEWRLGRRATALDVSAQRVHLDDGAQVPYDAVVVATGARPRSLRVPGAGLAGVHVLRSVSDCRALTSELASAHRVVVVGAGFIGCEVAASCRYRGVDVTLVELGPLPLVDALGAEPGQAVLAVLTDHGVAFRSGVAAQGFEGTERVEGVRLSTGELLPADLVVVAIGVEPNTEWLVGSGLTVSDGVVCDATGRADQGVFAAGDVARWDHALFGPIRVEHWSTAVEHGLYLGRRLLADGTGDLAPFAGVPFFWSDLFDAKLQFVGVAAGTQRHPVDGLPDGQSVVLYERDGVVMGAFGLRCPATVLRLRPLMGRASRAEVLGRVHGAVPATGTAARGGGRP